MNRSRDILADLPFTRANADLEESKDKYARLKALPSQINYVFNTSIPFLYRAGQILGTASLVHGIDKMIYSPNEELQAVVYLYGGVVIAAASGLAEIFRDVQAPSKADLGIVKAVNDPQPVDKISQTIIQESKPSSSSRVQVTQVWPPQKD